MTRVIATSKEQRRAAHEAYDEVQDFLPTRRMIKSPGFCRAVTVADKAAQLLVEETPAQKRMRERATAVRERLRKNM